MESRHHQEKVLAATPITVDDVLYRMDSSATTSHLFIDAERIGPRRLYRRKGWDYGVIGLEVGRRPPRERAGEVRR